MLMVILGAGASHDAVHRDNLRMSWQPPTTDGLFGPNFRDILRDIPAAQGPAEEILAAVRRASGSGERAGLLEAELLRLRDLAPTDRTKFRDLEAVRFYIQDVVQRCSELWLSEQAGVTNHAWLVAQLEEWRAIHLRGRTIYVTFNYDTILDQALAGRFGWNPRDSNGLDGYIRDNRFALLKLHGSYDWSQVTTLNQRGPNWLEARQDLISLAGGYGVREEYRLLSAGSSTVPDRLTANLGDLFHRDQDGGRSLCAPAVALPMSDKTQFVCPQSHQELLDQVVPLTTGVLAIGWRAAERHFLARLQNLQPGVPFWVVSPRTASVAVRRLQEAGLRAAFTPRAATFSDFREEGSLPSFLASALSEPPRSEPERP